MSEQQKSDGFAEALDAPIPATAGGVTYNLPILDLDDLALIGREIIAAQKEKALKGIPILAPDGQRQAVLARFDNADVNVDALSQQAFTLEGFRRFLRRSLTKAGAKDADAWIVRYVRENGVQVACGLAGDVSGLFPPRPKVKEGSADPNAPAGTTSDPASHSATSDAPSSSPAAAAPAA